MKPASPASSTVGTATRCSGCRTVKCGNNASKDDGHYHAESPEVELHKNLMGFWVLEGGRSGQSIGVKRLQ